MVTVGDASAPGGEGRRLLARHARQQSGHDEMSLWVVPDQLPSGAQVMELAADQPVPDHLLSGKPPAAGRQQVTVLVWRGGTDSSVSDVLDAVHRVQDRSLAPRLR